MSQDTPTPIEQTEKVLLERIEKLVKKEQDHSKVARTLLMLQAPSILLDLVPEIFGGDTSPLGGIVQMMRRGTAPIVAGVPMGESPAYDCDFEARVFGNLPDESGDPIEIVEATGVLFAFDGGDPTIGRSVLIRILEQAVEKLKE